MLLRRLLPTIAVLAVALIAVPASAGSLDEPAEATTADLAAAPRAEAAVPADLSLLGEPAVSSSSDCNPELAAALAGSEGDPSRVGLPNCGACSDPQCQGSPRGTFCWAGSPWNNGPGNCNIYSGGFICSPGGGWDCQCGSGPLP